MEKYRFVKVQHNQKWYARHPRGAVAGLKRQHAELFTDDDYQEWGEAGGWTAEPLGEDEAIRAGGDASKHPEGWAMTLPGFED